MPNFNLIGPSISIWHLKQIPVGVAIAKPHLHVVSNAHPVTRTQHVKFQLDFSIN